MSISLTHNRGLLFGFAFISGAIRGELTRQAGGIIWLEYRERELEPGYVAMSPFHLSTRSPVELTCLMRDRPKCPVGSSPL